MSILGNKDRLNVLASLIVKALLILVPFYAVLSVWFYSLVGHFTLVRLWDEYLLCFLVFIGLVKVFNNEKLRSFVVNDWLSRLTASYILLTILLGLVGYFNHDVSLKATFYGLLINLRYLIWFGVIRLLATDLKIKDTTLFKIIFYPLSLVVIFGLLQFFLLPHSFLGHFGYGNGTYPQFITINQNSPTIRIQSFLRGPNPLGAYLAAVLCILIAYLVKAKKKLWPLALLLISFFALYLTFSRSSIIGLVVGVVTLFFMTLRTTKQRNWYISIVIILCLFLGTGYLLTKNNQTIEDVLLHHNNHSTAVITSNQGHLAALKTNLKQVIKTPLGNGPGSSGQASWYNSGHSVSNPEDYFIQIAEEVGWLGLILYLAILAKVAHKLWQNRDHPLALGLLSGLVAISIISLFSYTWSDDTLAFLWWGLAGITLSTLPPSKSSSERS